MSYLYEATVDVHLYDAFRAMMTRVLERQGFRAGLHVPTLEGAGMMEYHRGHDVVVFSIAEEAQGQNHLTVRSESVNVVPLVISVVEELATDLTASFWAPAAGVSRQTLVRDIGQALRRIWTRVGSSTGAARGG